MLAVPGKPVIEYPFWFNARSVSLSEIYPAGHTPSVHLLRLLASVLPMTTNHLPAVLAIHGGAGTLSRSVLPADQAALHLAALQSILQAGQTALAAGASALDVVVEAVRRLEESPFFNAGRGAVYTAAATHELDACVIDGHGLRAGALAGLTTTRNPVLAARAVLQDGAHVMYAGPAADAVAARLGCEQVSPGWFDTPHRLAQLEKALADQTGVLLDHDGKFGTVGAVAQDAQGHLAAATSTGGMTNKQPGRVGDSPLIGAGCYANDATVAVSCTGTGEAFMRGLAAHDVSALIAYAGLSLTDATNRVVMDTLPTLGGRGGLIAVSANGDVALPFNTEGMYRGYARVGAEQFVAIYQDEPSAD